MNKLFLVGFILLLFTSCGKEEPREVEVIMISADLVEDKIECRFEVLVDGLAKVSEVAGIYWGTGANPSKSGVKLSDYTASSGKLKVIISDFDYSKTYYFQGYAIVDHVEHLSNVMYLPIGAGWKKMDTMPFQQEKCFSVTPNKTIHVAGEMGQYFISYDKGNTWTNVAQSDQNLIFELEFINDNVGYMKTATECRKTIDGGLTWNVFDIPAINFDPIYIFNEDIIFVPDDDVLYKTIDGGQNWTTITSTTNFGSMSLFFMDQNNGFALDYSTSVLKTTDGGMTWSSIYFSALGGGLSIHFFDGSNGVFAAGEDIYRSSNGGVEWIKCLNGTNGGYISEMQFYETSFGVASTKKGEILITNNAGNNWEYQFIPSDGEELRGVQMVDADFGIALDKNGQLYTYQ